MSSEQRKAVITIGLYQYIGSITDCLAVEDLMQNLKQVENVWVHDKDNEKCDLPDNYWVVPSDARKISLTFVDRDHPVMSDLDRRHIRHMERRTARWEAEEEERESSDES